MSLGIFNSRLKDFYDIYILSKTYDFDGVILKTAVQETFAHRGTIFNHFDAFDEEFISPYKKGQWKSFIRDKGPNYLIELEEIVKKVKNFVEPIIIDDISRKKWSHLTEEWK